MRRILAFVFSYALLLALLMAPYQHVHLAGADGGGHDDSAVVHVHFFSTSSPIPGHAGPLLDDADHDHLSRPLNTFATLPHAGILLFIPAEWFLRAFVPAPSFTGVQIVETRGHDPPGTERQSPRGPPA